MLKPGMTNPKATKAKVSSQRAPQPSLRRLDLLRPGKRADLQESLLGRDLLGLSDLEPRLGILFHTATIVATPIKRVGRAVFRLIPVSFRFPVGLRRHL